MNKILNSIFPVGGGVLGSTIGAITLTGIMQCMIYAAIGACVGYGIKLLLDYLIKKIKKK